MYALNFFSCFVQHVFTPLHGMGLCLPNITFPYLTQAFGGNFWENPRGVCGRFLYLRSHLPTYFMSTLLEEKETNTYNDVAHAGQFAPGFANTPYISWRDTLD